MPRSTLQNIIRSLSILLLLGLLFGSAQSGIASPQPAVRGKQLLLLPLYFNNRTICTGQYETFSVLVNNNNMRGVAGATVYANNKIYTTGADGMAQWRMKGEQPGQAKLKVYATKSGYTQSSSYEVTINVIDCQWNLRMDYGDEFADESYIWNFQGSVEIEDTPFTVNEDGSLSLLTGGNSIEAHYRASAYNLNIPMSCTPSPTLEGPYSIQFDGKYESGYMKIKLFAIPVALPSMVTFNCTPADPNITIKPWTYPTGQQLALIQNAKLTEIYCAIEGCVKRFKVNRVQMWPFDSANYASGVLIIEKLNK